MKKFLLLLLVLQAVFGASNEGIPAEEISRLDFKELQDGWKVAKGNMVWASKSAKPSSKVISLVNEKNYGIGIMKTSVEELGAAPEMLEGFFEYLAPFSDDTQIMLVEQSRSHSGSCEVVEATSTPHLEFTSLREYREKLRHRLDEKGGASGSRECPLVSLKTEQEGSAEGSSDEEGEVRDMPQEEFSKAIIIGGLLAEEGLLDSCAVQ